MPIDIDQILQAVDVRILALLRPTWDTGEEIFNADINATSSGDTTVVASTTDSKIRVISICFTVSAQVAVAWKSGSAVTKIAAMSFPQYGGMNQDYRRGWFVEANVGQDLVINLSGNANVRGLVNYVLIGGTRDTT